MQSTPGSSCGRGRLQKQAMELHSGIVRYESLTKESELCVLKKETLSISNTRSIGDFKSLLHFVSASMGVFTRRYFHDYWKDQRVI
ncbi:hypothetical protein CEXT_135501 [Caerostris extrusa]|uniref:Uncharacterized protein n=1 Tax=Caerostris extrusa TaxID=172846 RepID=A0AAV4UEJ1_CAEEX|nr:hypothetical protein CEXT_135501 [Caerostris extrusa]